VSIMRRMMTSFGFRRATQRATVAKVGLREWTGQRETGSRRRYHPHVVVVKTPAHPKLSVCGPEGYGGKVALVRLRIGPHVFEVRFPQVGPYPFGLISSWNGG
jgi:hypothetical protein